MIGLKIPEMASTARSRSTDFVTLDKLGEGSYGQVYKAKRIADDQVYVIKKVNISELSRKEQLAAINEVKLLAGMDHAHVVQYFDSFIDDGALYIVMEYCDKGDLSHMMKRTKARGESVPEPRIWSIFCQMLLGLHYLHNQRVLHRDMKTANVFLTKSKPVPGSEQSRLIVKIGDLGVAKLLGTNNPFADTVVGTPYYLSPELVQDRPYNGKSDMWATGVILYELCTCKRPFEAQNQCALILKIVRGEFAPVPPERASSELIEFINQLLRLDPQTRPSARKLLKQPRIQHEFDMLRLELPSDIEPVVQTSPLLSPTNFTRQNKATSRIVSSRLENLAQPRKEVVGTTTTMSQYSPSRQPVVPSTDDIVVVRGGRVRGGGARKISHRARQRPPSQQGIHKPLLAQESSDPTVTSYASSPSKGGRMENSPASMRIHSQRRAGVRRASRPTVADLYAKKEDKDEANVHEVNVQILKKAEEKSDVTSASINTSSQQIGHDDEVECSANETLDSEECVVFNGLTNDSFRLETKDCVDVEKRAEDQVVDQSTHDLSCGDLDASREEAQFSRSKLQVIGWAAAARSEAKQLEEVEVSDDPQDEFGDDSGEEYEDEDWENDSDGCSGANGSHDTSPEQTLMQIAETSRSQCIKVLGSEEALEDLCLLFQTSLRRPGSSYSLTTEQELFEKVKLLCGNDRGEAQHIALCVQRYLAAKIGLRGEKEEDDDDIAQEVDDQPDCLSPGTSQIQFHEETFTSFDDLDEEYRNIIPF